VLLWCFFSIRLVFFGDKFSSSRHEGEAFDSWWDSRSRFRVLKFCFTLFWSSIRFSKT
jgi:hypothetical protein